MHASSPLFSMEHAVPVMHQENRFLVEISSSEFRVERNDRISLN